MSAIRVVFLDAGGTLLHPDRAFLLDLLSEHGARLPDLGTVERAARARIRAMLTGNEPGTDGNRVRVFWEAFVRAAGCPDDAVEAATDAILEHDRRGGLWTHLEEDTPETLRALRDDGFRLAVVSNADGRVASFLDRAGLGPYLDFIVDSAVVGVEKPDPRIFEIALERAGVGPSEAVHVGDIYGVDVAGARAAGLEGILLDRTGNAPDADCRRLSALTELPALLGTSSGTRGD